MAYMLPELERLGVHLYFGPKFDVTTILRNQSNEVSDLLTRSGATFEAKHYWMHTGAYSDPEYYRGTDAYGKLAGVKGYWMRIKNANEVLHCPEPPKPNKIHGGKYPLMKDGENVLTQVADLNCMPVIKCDGSWDLIIGSGYNFVGVYPFEGIVDSPECKRSQDRIYRAFIEVAKRVYGLSHLNTDKILKGEYPYHNVRIFGVRSHSNVPLSEAGSRTSMQARPPFLKSICAPPVRWPIISVMLGSWPTSMMASPLLFS